MIFFKTFALVMFWSAAILTGLYHAYVWLPLIGTSLPTVAWWTVAFALAIVITYGGYVQACRWITWVYNKFAPPVNHLGDEI